MNEESEKVFKHIMDEFDRRQAKERIEQIKRAKAHIEREEIARAIISVHFPEMVEDQRFFDTMTTFVLSMKQYAELYKNQ